MKKYLSLILINLAMLTIGFYLGMVFYEAHTKPEIITKEIITVVYRYPNTLPYEEFDDPIDFDQALVLLQGMRASHIEALNWIFETSPGFGIADKEFQNICIKWYDQLIDFIWRQEQR